MIPAAKKNSSPDHNALCMWSGLLLCPKRSKDGYTRMKDYKDYSEIAQYCDDVSTSG